MASNGHQVRLGVRNLAKYSELVDKYQGKPVEVSSIKDAVEWADIVVSTVRGRLPWKLRGRVHASFLDSRQYPSQ